MDRRFASSVPPKIAGFVGRSRHPVGRRPRALTAIQESLFFAVMFALGLVLQLTAIFLAVGGSG